MAINNKIPVHTFGRVLYVEPNDVSGAVNGVPLTPDYTDMCISFNLICEVKSRIQNDIPTGETTVNTTDKDKKKKAAIYQIFGVTGNGDSKSWVSFLQGEAYKDTNSLTTYYVDINYDDYLKNNIVEGLGVENITVSHESYYTPNVSIKFVDHRGASLFGREEATHYNDKLTIDNIFGAFFTAPYPEYYLQVKGFYGKPITYRLCCTGFKGALNSQTGNFEAVATFVGYSYSILTDIPFEYLVAAPYCKYVGEDYWKAHRGLDDWRLAVEGGASETNPVPTLYELLQRINAAFTDESLLQVISDEEKELADRGAKEKNILEGIKSGFDTFVNKLKSRCTNFISDSDKFNMATVEGDGEYKKPYEAEHEQLLLMKSDNSDTDWGSIEELWNSINKAIDKYNDAFEDNAINEDFIPAKLPFRQMRFTDYFLIDENNNVRINDIKELTIENIKKLKINGVEPSEVMATKIYNTILDKDKVSNLKKYVYLVDLGWLNELLESKISQIATEIDEINRKSEHNYIHLALGHLGVVPYMGNIFKIIMCHIETFVQMMKQCFININRAKEIGLRHPAYLGVNIKNTDFVANDNKEIFLPPWPAVNRKDTADSEYADIEKNNTFGWVGDFSNNFEEAKLVRALYAACKHTAADPSKIYEGETVEFRYTPIVPNDLNNDRNPFDRGEYTLSALGGMLGIRIAQIFGIGELKKIPDDIAKTLGKIDALNYYLFVPDKTKIKENIVEKTDNLANALYDIMLCKPSADKYCDETDEATGKQSHDFEFTDHLFNDIPDRQPIFAEVNDILNYTYMPNSKGYGIVPSNTRYKREYLPGSGNDYLASTEDNTRHYIKVDYLNDKTFLHYCNATQLFEDYENPEESVRKYKNHEMYMVVTGTQHVNKILERYKQMRGGVIKVSERAFKIDMSKVLDRYWFVDDSLRYSFMTNTSSFFSRTYKECGIEDRMLLGSNFDKTSNVDDTLGKLRNIVKASFKSTDKLTYDDDGSEANPLTAFIRGVICQVGSGLHSLFGIDFYYMQNQIQDADVRNHVKAFLFLHSLFYNKNLTMKWDVTQINNSCIARVPFGLAALYGGFLWRHKYILDHTKDPILYGDGNENIYRPAYTPNGKEYTLFALYVDGTWGLKPRLMSESGYSYLVFGENKTTNALFVRDPDYMVVNELISIFELFIKNQWQTIKQLELRKSDGSAFSDGKSFREYIIGLTKKYEEAIINQEIDTEDIKIAKAEAISNASKNLASFTTNYSFLWFYMRNQDNVDVIDRLDLWLNPANTTMQEALRSTYLGDCIELRSMCTTLNENAASKIKKYTDVYAQTDNVKSYLNGFAEQINDIVENKDNGVISDEELGIIEDTPEFNRETAIPIYIYLKMLWDKWLVSLDLDDNEFSVKNFNDNFVFIDSFYRNITNRFMVNCQILLDCYNSNMSSNLDISVFKFIGDLTTKHNCMFITVPDFIANWSSRSDTEVRTSMETVFVPLPYNSMGKMRINNKFVTMYIPKLSETPSEMNNFRSDGFNIWSYNDPIVERGDSTVRTKNSVIPKILDSVSEVVAERMWTELDYSRYSYYVPAFGLAYGRQNNAIFKNLNLSMDAPATNSVVINTLSHTARMGANNTHRIAFIGQDLYPVYSNYAYLCEFEMMGCAQIQPLMYFQLMNVPMWRGTYLIYSVTHTMTPGNMVTRVKAMKLSNRAVPYSNAWFTKNPNFDENELKKLQCLENLVQGVTIGVVSTPSSDNDNDNNSNLDYIGGNDNIIKGDHSGTTPVLVGDSWGVGLGKCFRGDCTAVGSSAVCDSASKSPISAVAQITQYLKTKPNPKFILLYSGRNFGTTNASKNCYEAFIKACNGNTVYLIQEQYDCHPTACKNGDRHSKNVIDTLNANMKTLCGNTGGKYKNAHFLDLNAKGFNTASNNYSVLNCCQNDGCGCGQGNGDGYHLKSYRDMLKTALEIIGETSYLK